MLTPFQLGFGAVLGSGEQGLSWVHIDDVAHALLHLIERDDLDGPVNIVAPKPLSQKEFAVELAATLNRPLWLRVPSWLFKPLPGNMGEEMVLTSQFAVPDRLNHSGYTFKYPELYAALKNLLG
jgi:NAD dependent epimerase/dehydratase family enzyme